MKKLFLSAVIGFFLAASVTGQRRLQERSIERENTITANRIYASDANTFLSSVTDLTSWIAGGSGVTIADDGDGTVTVSTDGTGDGDTVGPGSATDNAIARWDTTTGKLLQDSTSFLDDSGNVAFGLAVDPTSTIEVHKSSNPTVRFIEPSLGDNNIVGDLQWDALDSGSASQEYGRIRFYAITDDAGAEKGGLRFRTAVAGSLAEHFHFVGDRLGVGAGASSPGDLLHLADATAPILRLDNTDTTVTDDQLLSKISVYQNDASNSNAETGYVRWIANGVTGNADLEFGTGVGAVTTKMTLQSTGNVGIGTASPSENLEVEDSSGIVTIKLTNDIGSGRIRLGGGDVLELVNELNDHLIFGTNDLERVRITDAGNVGIGTTSPDGGLHISKDSALVVLKMSVHSNTSTDTPYIQLMHTRGTEASPTATQAEDLLGVIQAGGYDTAEGSEPVIQFAADAEWGTGGDGSDNPTRIMFLTTPDGSNSEAERMRITSSGKMGLGTTSPDGTLHVHTATAGAVTAHSAAAGLIVENSAAGGISSIVPDASNNNFYFASPANNAGSLIRWSYNDLLMTLGTNTASADLRFIAGAFLEAARITSAGRLGINTTTPGAKLEVVAAGANSIFNSGAATDARLEFEYNSARVGQLSWFSNSIKTILDAGTDYAIRSGGVDRFFVKESDGSVGFGGMTAPTSPVHIKGQGIGAHSLEVQASGGTATIIELEEDGTTGNGQIVLRDTAGLLGAVLDGGVGVGASYIRNDFGLGDETSPDFPLDIMSNFTNDETVRTVEIDHDVDTASSPTANRIHNGIYLDMDTASQGTSTNGNRFSSYGLYSAVTENDSGVAGKGHYQLINRYGLTYINNPNGYGPSDLYGSYEYVNIEEVVNNGLTIPDTFGSRVLIKSDCASCTLTNVYGYRSEINQDDAGGTITNSYAFSALADRDDGTHTNSYLYYGDSSGTIGTSWGIYITGVDKNYFANATGIGTTTPATLVEVEDATSETAIQISNTATDGDVTLALALDGTRQYTFGIDDGAGDEFRMGTTAINTSTFMAVDNAGRFELGPSNIDSAIAQAEGVLAKAFVSAGAANNTSVGSFGIVSGLALSISSGRIGSGGFLPITFSSNGERYRMLAETSILVFDEADVNPTTADLDDQDSFAIYRKADKLVFAYNRAGVMTYIVLSFDGTDIQFSHNTSAP